MKAEDISFYFLSTPSYYDIPFFQRAYVWNSDNWGELLSDLTNKKPSHFLGSIILKNELKTAGNIPRFSVIDGQQRLTTLSVLLRACYDHMVKNAEKYELDSEFMTKCKVIMENLLFVSESEGGFKESLHVKINHSHLDKPAFENVINGELDKDDRWERYVNLPEDDNTSNIIKAYAFFRSELIELSQDEVGFLWNLLTANKIKFLVNIDLDVDDNEQDIFDTVNSSGVRLSSADTIKNLLYQKYVELLRASDCRDVDKVAISEYDNTWVDAFVKDDKVNAYWETQRQYGRMKRTNIETFLHAFAVVKGFFNPAENNMSDLSGEYRTEISNMDIESLDSFLVEMHDYALVYMDYYSDDDEALSFDDYIGRLFNICNVLEVSTFYPYILKQLYSWKKDKITEEELKSSFYEIERYVILNAICKGSTKNYNNECIQLVEERKTPKEIMDSSIYISEGSFKDGLRRMTTNKLPTLLLFWVELYIRKSSLSDIKSLKYGFTLEHIMPQKWMQNWQDVTAYDREGNELEELDEIDRVRSKAIYEIGNMTLLNSKLNTSISNGAFIDKINGKYGKKGVKHLADLLLTKEVVENNTEWDELKIYKRTDELESLIRTIWSATDLPIEAVTKHDSGSAGRKELRLEFWEYALPIIREMNNYEAYMNVGPTTNNECGTSVGIGDFRVVCVANYDISRVYFNMGKNRVEENKEAFDILYEHRQEIEEKVGVTLNWDRADSFKASWVNIDFDDIGIINKDNWKKIAKFFGEWSLKLRKTMLPYLWDRFSVDTISERSPEEKAKLKKLSDIYKEWMMSKKEINGYLEKCSITNTRFKTELMSEVIPDTPEALSGWSLPNHYFYELVNRNTSYAAIALSFNSKNLIDEQRDTIRKISEIVGRNQPDNWQWWKAYRSERIEIPDDMNKDVIFANLDKALEEILQFEKNLKSKLDAEV
ncbi:DUF4268 domain-containing protein [Eubacterium sp.]|uniref:DUF4268 domain-containing protein n=1 Tax=Eubacterium sp. TaxID=142586 RepID=UPI0025F78647|nr:DUF4268 domain-containing protein [Eubacterium sp.]MCR5628145.1 DUF4268 domain-containing protein [Eubacterium sp.]